MPKATIQDLSFLEEGRKNTIDELDKGQRATRELFNRFAQAAGPGLYAPSDEEQIDEKMKYSRRALWKRTATNMPEESEHSYSKRNQG